MRVNVTKFGILRKYKKKSNHAGILKDNTREEWALKRLWFFLCPLVYPKILVQDHQWAPYYNLPELPVRNLYDALLFLCQK